jgi:hypothetical protein
MAEVWLRNNRRALLVTALPAGILLLLGGGLVIGARVCRGPLWPYLTGGFAVMLAAAWLGLLLWQARQPRLAYADEHLLVKLRAGPPLRVPIDVVECFLLGRAPSLLPGKNGQELETATVVIRLSPQAPEWTCGRAEPALGCWCESHIILRGTWCEPLDMGVVRRLNSYLGQATRARRTADSQSRGGT